MVNHDWKEEKICGICPLNERANTASDGDFYNPPKSVGALGTRMLEDVLVFSGPRSVLPHVTH